MKDVDGTALQMKHRCLAQADR